MPLRGMMKLLVNFMAAMMTWTACAHDASKCRENGQLDNDCCALKDQMACADGYTLKQEGGECLANLAFRYTCTAPGGNGTSKPVPGTHDPSKCRENGKLDSDCCAMESQMSCADGYTLQKGMDCFGGMAYKYTCAVPDPDAPGPVPGTHDPSKCREYGRLDNDCCALKDQMSCADGYLLTREGGECLANIAYRYTCKVPTGVTSASASLAVPFFLVMSGFGVAAEMSGTM